MNSLARALLFYSFSTIFSHKMTEHESGIKIRLHTIIATKIFFMAQSISSKKEDLYIFFKKRKFRKNNTKNVSRTSDAATDQSMPLGFFYR